MDLAKIQGLFVPLMRLMAGVSYLIVFYIGGKQAINGTTSIGDIVAFFGYLGMLTWPVIAVGWVVSLYQRGTASLARINHLLHTQPLVFDTEQSRHRQPMNGRIEFRDLHFSYDGRPVLDGINLTIEPGQTVGLVGLTGSGKTTLVNLIARLHPVPRGQLFVDGVDINDWPIAELRRQIGFATQEPFLFSDTIADNIRFGRRDADMERVRWAGDIAALEKDVREFPHGYETLVGERGLTLSGGQKQRTAIARAILVDPTILILDDATSAVDTETEHEISNKIKEVLTGRTSIIISHRVSAVKEADFIICLEHGRITEQGDHDTLMARNGFYAELYRSQLLEKELEAL
jgi:ATP-binding cassette subfamily B protein